MATKQMDQLKRFKAALQARANATNKASASGNVGQVGQPQKKIFGPQVPRQNPNQRPSAAKATPAQIAAMKAQREAAFKRHISQQKQQTVPKAPVGTPQKRQVPTQRTPPFQMPQKRPIDTPPKKRAGAITGMRGSAGLNQKGRKNSKRPTEEPASVKQAVRIPTDRQPIPTQTAKQYSYSNGGLTRTTDKLKTGIKNGV
tara:strand:- start:259 stop:858 length:600 start_codon:yes stop_codon:yes gene_type:complete